MQQIWIMINLFRRFGSRNRCLQCAFHIKNHGRDQSQEKTQRNRCLWPMITSTTDSSQGEPPALRTFVLFRRTSQMSSHWTVLAFLLVCLFIKHSDTFEKQRQTSSWWIQFDGGLSDHFPLRVRLLGKPEWPVTRTKKLLRPSSSSCLRMYNEIQANATQELNNNAKTNTTPLCNKMDETNTIILRVSQWLLWFHSRTLTTPSGIAFATVHNAHATVQVVDFY
jgi:hypothetical protein